jgi:hypothetical protein
MNGYNAFATGVAIGRATAPGLRRRTPTVTPDPLCRLSLSASRVAPVFGQVIGALTSGLFLGYAVYTFLVVMK